MKTINTKIYSIDSLLSANKAEDYNDFLKRSFLATLESQTYNDIADSSRQKLHKTFMDLYAFFESCTEMEREKLGAYTTRFLQKINPKDYLDDLELFVMEYMGNRAVEQLKPRERSHIVWIYILLSKFIKQSE